MSQPSPAQRRLIFRLGKYLYPFWPNELSDPTFIVGCPRSGTTVLGKIISQHPSIFYLFEPRPIWVQTEPRLNIWGENAEGGQLDWSASDAFHPQARDLRRWFHIARTIGGRPYLVEKLPLNIFRLTWLLKTFPKAHFIHIIRHGRDVALSMCELVARRFPPGYWETHWNYLMFEDFASRQPSLHQALEETRRAGNNYSRALLVWVCSITAANEARQFLPPESLLEIKYKSLIKNSQNTIQNIFDFLPIPISLQVQTYAKSELHAHSLKKNDPYPELTQLIAGNMLDELGFNS